MKPFDKRSIVFSMALIATGCAGGASGTSAGGTKGGLGPSAVSGTLTAEDIATTEAKNAINDMKDDAVPTNIEGKSVFSNININNVTISSEDDYESCSTKEGSLTDKDAAGVPYDYKVTYNCNNLVTTDRTTTYTGSYRIQSKATAGSTDKYSGLKLTLDLVYAYEIGTRTSRSIYQAEFETGISGTTYSYTGKYNYKYTDTEYGGGLGGTNYSYSWTAPTGTAANDIYKQGTAQFAGFHNATWTKDGVTKTVIFKISTTDLTYDSTTCTSTYYKSGTISFTDSSGNDVTYTYNNCVATRTYNGTNF